MDLIILDPTEAYIDQSTNCKRKKGLSVQNPDNFEFLSEKTNRRIAQREFAGKIVNVVQSSLVPQVAETEDTALKSRLLHGTKTVGSIIVGEGVSYFLKDTLPSTLKWFYKRSTTRWEVNGDVSGKEQKRVYAEIISFLREQPGWNKLSNMATFHIDGSESAFTRFSLSLPTSGHMFIKFDGKRIMVTFDIVNYERMTWNDTTTDVFPRITFTIFGKDVPFMERFEDHFYNIVEQKVTARRERNPDAPPVMVVRVFDKDGDCKNQAVLPGRPVESLAITDEVRDEIFASAKKWSESKKFYEENFIPHKFVIVLEGDPGTGKTSIAKALATEMGRTLCVASFAELSNKNMSHFMSNAYRHGRVDTGSKGPIILFEDFDDDEVIRSRKSGGKRSVDMTVITEKPEKEGVVKGGVTPTAAKVQTSEKRSLSGVLNVFDGPIPLDDIIIILTTNTIDDIDEAVLRHGRVDKIVRVGALSTSEVVRYLLNRLPDIKIPKGFKCVNPIKGCDLQQILIEHHDDHAALIKEVLKKTS